jgi:NAD(P)-dependent dehydrogenase (short-subunit alcohol dehydrogenase family)
MADRTAAVLGLGRTGRSACRALAASGARVWAWDDDPERRRDAAASGIPIADLAMRDWDHIACLVLSPGVPLTHPRPHPVVRLARAHGVPVVGDVELLVENQPERRIVGIGERQVNHHGADRAAAARRWPRHATWRQYWLAGTRSMAYTCRLLCVELTSYQWSDRAPALRRGGNLNVTQTTSNGTAAWPATRAKRRILRNQGAMTGPCSGSMTTRLRALSGARRPKSARRVLPVVVGRALGAASM